MLVWIVIYFISEKLIRNDVTFGDDGSFMFRALFHNDESLAYVGLVKPQKIDDKGSNGIDEGFARPQEDLEAAALQDNWIAQQRVLSKSYQFDLSMAIHNMYLKSTKYFLNQIIPFS